MQKAFLWLNLGLVSIASVLLFTASKQSGAAAGPVHNSPANGYALPQIIRAVDLNKDFVFANERVPTDNFDVRERLDRELMVNSYLHSSTILAIKQTMRYLPTIDAILREEGIPEDFKYLAVAESSLRNAVSSAGARGIWQFMRLIGDHYGLEISEDVDERYHLEKATRAAAKYLRSYHKRFGNWTLAAAAYNMGGTRMAKDLETQGVDNYYDLHLNAETSRYIFRIIALKEILQRPEDFGFYLEEDDYYPAFNDYREVEVKSAIPSLAKFALEHGTTYRMLKLYNPWLISYKLSNKAGKVYKIKLPKK